MTQHDSSHDSSDGDTDAVQALHEAIAALTARTGQTPSPDEGPSAGTGAKLPCVTMPAPFGPISETQQEADFHEAPRRDAFGEGASRSGFRRDTGHESFATPRAARPGGASWRDAEPISEAGEAPEWVSRSDSSSATGTPARPRSRRFAVLAASVALSAGIGWVGGSLGVNGVKQFFSPIAPAPVHADAPEDLHALKDAIVQLRGNLKSIGENVAALRASVNTSSSATSAQLAKITEGVEKVMHVQADRREPEHHATAAPSASPAPAATAPETTGGIPTAAEAKAALAGKPAIVEGWIVTKVYNGAALVEGRYGVIEVEPGDNLPGVGRIQEIKRQDGRWVVVTSKGLILER